MPNEKYNIKINGEQYIGACMLYHDGPLDFYVEDADICLGCLDVETTPDWICIKGRGLSKRIGEHFI